MSNCNSCKGTKKIPGFLPHTLWDCLDCQGKPVEFIQEETKTVISKSKPSSPRPFDRKDWWRNYPEKNFDEFCALCKKKLRYHRWYKASCPTGLPYPNEWEEDSNKFFHHED